MNAGRQARPSANRIGVGIIGFGGQGVRLARQLAAVPGSELTAVADLYDGRLRRARELGGDGMTVERDGRRLLERRDVEAVVIATPDHWHVPLMTDALAAGKDVYIECPVSHSAVDEERLEKALAGSDRVIQCGGGWITSPPFRAARRLLLEGRIGRPTLVRATWDTASALDAWQIPFPPDASPESIDFHTFVAPAAQRPFDLFRFFRWRCYEDYGSGLAGARLAPQLTAIHWLLDLPAPAQVTAAGALQRWKDGREVPDVVHVVLRYETGVTVALGAAQNGGSARELRVIGTEATLAIDDAGLTVTDERGEEPYTTVGETWSREYRDWFYMMHGMSPQGVVRGAPQPERALERFTQPDGAATAAAHLADFVECIRTRRAPAESIALGRTVAQVTRIICKAMGPVEREQR